MKKKKTVLTKGILIIHAPEAKTEVGKSYIVLDKFRKDVGLNFIAVADGLLVENKEFEFISSSECKPHKSIFKKDIPPVASTEDEIRKLYDMLMVDDKKFSEDFGRPGTMEPFDEYKLGYFMSFHVSSIHTIMYSIQCTLDISDEGKIAADNFIGKYHIINGVITEGEPDADWDTAELTTHEISEYVGKQPAQNLEPNNTEPKQD